MKTFNQTNYQQFHQELEKLKEKYKPEAKPSFWSFLRDMKFWFEVAKLIIMIIL